VKLQLRAGELDLATLQRAWRGEPHGALELQLAATDWARVHAARLTVEGVIARGETVYGINTGFGQLAQTRIDAGSLDELQRNLVLSHACGVGELLDDACVRLVMLLKINSLARGHSGVRALVIERLIALLAKRCYPAIPAKGSVGASGDLAPLAHLGCALLGEGRVRRDGQLLPAAQALADLGLEPLSLRAKEGLALLNGTQVSTALALRGLFEAQDCADAALISGGLAVDAALGSTVPFDARIQAVRGQPGQIFAAARYRELLAGSAINASHADCDKVQDPYSLRCQPQVMGACLDQLRAAAQVLVAEANAVSDNPLVFPGQGDSDGEILSGGNFHAEPVAQAADGIAVALAEIGALSERRIALLIDAHLSQLPPFLIEENAGLNSGFMIAHVTAAALASENKSYAHPASVDSLPTSANQEDHVSMATFAARRLADIADNLRHILAVELLAAAQGIDLRRPLRSSDALERAHAAIRARVERWDRDRYFADDIAAISALIGRGELGDGAVAGYLMGSGSKQRSEWEQGPP